jgi:hypothetical protein
VQQQRRVAAVVENHVRLDWVAVGIVGPAHHLIGAEPVLLQGLSLPGEHRHALRILDGSIRADGHSGSRVVLGGEDVAARPTHFGAELDQRLDQDGGLDGHVQRSADPCAGERLGRTVFLADGAEAGHFVLGKMNLFAPEWCEREVGDAKVATRGERPGVGGGHSRFLQERVADHVEGTWFGRVACNLGQGPAGTGYVSARSTSHSSCPESKPPSTTADQG